MRRGSGDLEEPSKSSRLRSALLAGGVLAPLMGLVILFALPIGGYYAYRTYDYVQHDNDFCLSCHLMEGPYEAFARSEHRGLGCKACHRPTLVGRSQMALTQVVDQPEELGAHAEVPDAVCTECHVDGNPDQWRNIAASAGHRVHDESDDPALDGVRCVSCHSTSIHEFASVDETCGQSECHVDTEIQLGAMGDFTIHCVACHAFREPAPETDLEEVRVSLRPAEDECLSCHVMRAMVDLPADEPHDGVCATCHNPHSQAEAAQAVETCATAGCHDDVLSLTPLHRGLPDATVSDCVQCHSAHDFNVEGSDCQSCHADITSAPPAVIGARLEAEQEGGAGIGLGGLGVGGSVLIRPSSLLHAPLQVSAADTLLFAHDTHQAVPCAACHDNSESHGQVTVAVAEDCRSCHHTTESGVDECVICHTEEATFRSADLALPMRFALSVGEAREGSAGFSHALHAEQACAECHVGEPDLDVGEESCAACHVEHHEASVDCASCHLPPPAGAHEVEAHLGCGGADCHTDLPIQSVPRTRPFCITCHQDLRDHRPEENCVVCHPLPEPRIGA